MSKPPFTMSMYVTELDLQRDARKYYQERSERLEMALQDMLSGWKYIRETHGDLYGVGWNRAQANAETALDE